MKVLVTGGAGFIGSHVTEALVRQGHQVAVVDNFTAARASGAIHPSVVYYRTDITDSALDLVFSKEKPDFVFHLAAQVDVRRSLLNPAFDAETNILGTVRLLQCCVKHNVRKIVYSSSAAVYGPPVYLGVDEEHPVAPISFYGISKSVPEPYLRCFSELYGLQYTVLRYANVYGIGQNAKGEAGVVSIFLDKLLRGESPCIYGDGEQTRDFVYAADVAAANLLAMDKVDNGIFNIGCDRQTSVNELYGMMCGLLSIETRPEYREAREGDIPHSRLNSGKAAAELGWTPNYSLEDGLAETAAHYQKVYLSGVGK